MFLCPCMTLYHFHYFPSLTSWYWLGNIVILVITGLHAFSFLLNYCGLLANCDAGLGHLIAKNEDEYVQLALQLASDVAALSDLRMGLRDLMSKSAVCNGTNFILGLESTYRHMWHRYCKGDVPSSRHMELLQQQGVPEEAPIKTSEQTRIAFSKEGPPGSVVKANGFNSVSPSMVDDSCEENWNQLNHSTNSGKLNWKMWCLWGIDGDC